MKLSTCKWIDAGMYYETECKHEMSDDIFNVVPKLVFCPYCGLKVLCDDLYFDD